MYWHAKPGCPAHHRAAVERIINTYPPSYLVPPALGEIFDSLEESNRRIYEYTLTKGFNIIRYERGIKVFFNYRFKYIFYNNKT